MLNLKFVILSLLLNNAVAKESRLKALMDQPKVIKSTAYTSSNTQEKDNPQKAANTKELYEKMTDIPEIKFDWNEMVCLVNRERELAKEPAPPLTYSKTIARIAMAHSQDQAFHEEMTHTGSDGSNLLIRMQRNKYAGLAFAENVAWNQLTVEEVVRAWANSDGHYKNMVNPKYCELGASKVLTYWTQVFSNFCPKDNLVANCKGYEKRPSLRTK